MAASRAILAQPSLLIILTARFLAVHAGYHGPPPILDENCACVFNCEYCRLPSVLTTLDHNRGFCQDPDVEIDPAAQEWTTLQTADGVGGHCRTADGGLGLYATIDHVSESACAALCARTAACVAIEFSDKCELHATLPTHVEPVGGSAAAGGGSTSGCDCAWANGGASCSTDDGSTCWGVCCGPAAGGSSRRQLGSSPSPPRTATCRVKMPLPAALPLSSATSPRCCPTFDAKLSEVKDDGFKLSVKVYPWIGSKSLLLQMPGLVINDNAVRLEMDSKIEYLGLWGDGGGLAPPGAAAPGGASGGDGAVAGAGSQQRQLGGQSGHIYVDGHSALNSGVVLRLDSHDHGKFELRVRHARGSVDHGGGAAAGRRLGSSGSSYRLVSMDARITCLADPTTPFPPPLARAVPPAPPAPPAPPGEPPYPPYPPSSPGGAGGAGGREGEGARAVQCVRDTARAAAVCCTTHAGEAAAACGALRDGSLPRCAAGVTADCQYASAAACGGEGACPSPLRTTPGGGSQLTGGGAAGDTAGAMWAFLLLWLLTLCFLAPACFWCGMRRQHAQRRHSLAKCDGTSSADPAQDGVDLPLSGKHSAPGPPTGSMPPPGASDLNDAARQSMTRLSQAAAGAQPPPPAAVTSRQSSFVSVDMDAPSTGTP